MGTTTRLDRWLAPRIESRANDTLREINDDPTEVQWYRGNTSLGTLTVKIVDAIASAFSTVRGTASQGTQGQATILAPANTALRINDRMTAEGGRAWRILGVSQDRRVRTEAVADTA